MKVFTAALLATGFMGATSFGALAEDVSSTISTKNMTWNNSAYLELRDEKAVEQREALLAEGYFVNVPSELPVFQDAGGIQVALFAGVTMSEFSSFVEIHNPNGDCQETENLGDYSSVVCVFKDIEE
jgi:hypothetical protein